eukprot:scaffold265675_cov19-Tisochrysis_lutea.AAC.1
MPPPSAADSTSEHPSQFHAQRSTGPGFQGQAPGPSHQYYHEPLPSKLLEQTVCGAGWVARRTRGTMLMAGIECEYFGQSSASSAPEAA